MLCRQSVVHRGVCRFCDISKLSVPYQILYPYPLQLVREGPTYSSQACPNLPLTFQLQQLCLSGISNTLLTSGRKFSRSTRLVMPGAAGWFLHHCQYSHHLSEHASVFYLSDRPDEGLYICWLSLSPAEVSSSDFYRMHEPLTEVGYAFKRSADCCSHSWLEGRYGILIDSFVESGKH